MGLLKKKLYNQFLDRTMTSGLAVFYAAPPVLYTVNEEPYHTPKRLNAWHFRI
jgi:hypothetical protein